MRIVFLWPENGRYAQASSGVVRVGHRDTQISRGTSEDFDAKHDGGRNAQHAWRWTTVKVQQVLDKSEQKFSKYKPL